MFGIENLGGFLGFLIVCGSVMLAVAFAAEYFRTRKEDTEQLQVDELERLFTL